MSSFGRGTVVELRARCKELGIKNYSKMKKADLIAALKQQTKTLDDCFNWPKPALVADLRVEARLLGIKRSATLPKPRLVKALETYKSRNVVLDSLRSRHAAPPLTVDKKTGILTGTKNVRVVLDEATGKYVCELQSTDRDDWQRALETRLPIRKILGLMQ